MMFIRIKQHNNRTSVEFYTIIQKVTLDVAFGGIYNIWYMIV